MTAPQKVGAGVGAFVLAALGILFGAGAAPHLLPMLQFLAGEARGFVGLPLFDDVVISVFVGAVLPAWMPYVLPPAWPAHRTRRVTCLLGFGVAFLMVVTTYRNLIGLQYGMFAGSGAVMVYLLVADWYYGRHPCKVPRSLSDQPRAEPDA